MKKEDVVVNSEKQGWNANSGVPTSKRRHLKVIQNFFFKSNSNFKSVFSNFKSIVHVKSQFNLSQRLCRV